MPMLAQLAESEDLVALAVGRNVIGLVAPVAGNVGAPPHVVRVSTARHAPGSLDLGGFVSQPGQHFLDHVILIHLRRFRGRGLGPIIVVGVLVARKRAVGERVTELETVEATLGRLDPVASFRSRP